MMRRVNIYCDGDVWCYAIWCDGEYDCSGTIDDAESEAEARSIVSGWLPDAEINRVSDL